LTFLAVPELILIVIVSLVEPFVNLTYSTNGCPGLAVITDVAKSEIVSVFADADAPELQLATYVYPDAIPTSISFRLVSLMGGALLLLQLCILYMMFTALK
jgi:hypothetical protein